MELVILIFAFLVVEILNNKRIYDLEKRTRGEKKVLTNEEKRKMESMKASFDNLMKYDEEIARKRK